MFLLHVCMVRGAMGELKVSIACLGPLRLVIGRKSMMLLLARLNCFTEVCFA